MEQGAVTEGYRADVEHANAEQRHADQIAERINQLGGEPGLNPGNLVNRSHSKSGRTRIPLESFGKDEHDKADQRR